MQWDTLIQASHVPAGDGAWVFQPSIVGSGLTFANGSFNTYQGTFSASWKINDQNVVEAFISIPAGLSGTVYVPMLRPDSNVRIKIDSKPCVAGPRDGFVRCSNIGGGMHHIQA